MNRLVVWGARDSLDSIRHVWRAYHETALKLGIPSVWVDDRRPIQPLTGDTVLAADVTAKNLGYVPMVNYVLHNFDGASPLCRALEDTPERLLRLQVWTRDATGEEWAPFRQFDRAARTLFQPWGSDLLAEEFLEPVFNPTSRDVTFVGAVWSDQYQGTELGNEGTIRELRTVCAQRGLAFRHLTQIPDAAMRDAIRAARLAPSFAGAWQVEKGYLPCRYFKAAACGVLAFGNVPTAETLLGASSIANGSVEGTLGAALDLGRGQYLSLVREQQRVVSAYTYRQSLESIDLAFAEIQA